MQKSARIKAFVELVKDSNNAVIVQKCTGLFDKLVQNVSREYKKFHESREPRKNNLQIDDHSISESANDFSYLTNLNFEKFFSQIKDTQELPFAITQEIRDLQQPSLFTSVVFPKSHILKTTYFVNKNVSRETFHQIQRHHKIWWMKYGTNPGKYSISDQKIEGSLKIVNIRSNVCDTLTDVERLRLFSLENGFKDKDTLNHFKCRTSNRKRETIPEVIESVVDLQVASFALLTDAVNLSEDYTAFHRRSAPFQLALIVKEPSKDLVDLARYIELLVESIDPNISILNESEINSHDELSSQYQIYDDIGIPYVVVLDPTALDHGMFKLRNRNTTLSETIHISDVSNYLIKIFNSA